MAEPLEEITEMLGQVEVPPVEPPPPLEPNFSFENAWPHRNYVAARYPHRYLYSENQVLEPALRDAADMVCSQTIDGSHAPALDIDMPCRLVPSATEGHFHLYIDKRMTWRAYKKLLKALTVAGIIEPGYFKAAKKRKATYLRTPEKPKGKSRVVGPYGGGYW